MLRAELARAEATVADYRLDLLSAFVGGFFLVVAGWLLGHAAAEWESKV